MARTVVDHLKWIIGADSTEFRAEFDRARRSAKASVDGINNSVGGLQKSFGSLRNVVLGLLGAGSLGALVNNITAAAAKINDVSKVTGLSVETLSTWRFALDQNNASLESLQTGVVALVRAMSAAREESSAQAGVFKDLNIQLADANGFMRSTEDVLLDVADAFSRMEDGVTKTEVATKLFGGSARELIPFLNKGRDGIGQLTDKAREMGLELTADNVQALDDFRNLMGELAMEARGLAEAISVDVLPGITEWIRTVRLARAESGNLTAAWVALGGVGTALFTTTDAERAEELRGKIADLSEQLVEIDRNASMSWRDRGLMDTIFGPDWEAKAERMRGYIAEYQAELDALQPTLDEINKREQERLDRLRRQREEEATRRRAAAEELQRQREQRQLDEQARRDAEERAKRADNIIASMERERAVLGAVTREERIRAEISAGVYNDLTALQQQRLIDLAREIDQQNAQTKSLEEAARAAEEYERSMTALAEKVMKSVRTEAELLYEEVDMLDMLLSEGRISWHTYSLAMADVDNRMKELQKTSEESAEAMDDFGKQAARNAQTAFADFLFDPFSGGVRGMVLQFSDAMRRILSEALAARALRALLPASMFGAAEGGAIGMAAGGPVHGPGTGTSDSVGPVMLSRGEFVEPAATASHYGMDVMEALRRRALPRASVRALLGSLSGVAPHVPSSARFAEGGAAAGGGGSSGGGDIGVRIVNVVDKDIVEEFMNSPAGDKLLVNKIRRNSLAIRGELG